MSKISAIVRCDNLNLQQAVNPLSDKRQRVTWPCSRLLVHMAPPVEVRPICPFPRQPARKRTRVRWRALFRLGYRQYKKKESCVEGPHHDLPIRLAANERLLRA